MSATPRREDPLWPRAGDWPALDGSGADVIILGVPTEQTSLSPTRAGGTPNAIREALRRYSSSYVHRGGKPIDLSVLRVQDAGNLDDPDTEQGRVEAIQRVGELISGLSSRGLLIALGGDNSATYPIARAVAGDHPSRVGVITLDAHFDLRDGRSNGSPIRELLDEGIPGRQIVQIGIADFANSAAYASRAHAAGITVIPREALETEDLSAIATRALNTAGSPGGPIHLDVDVDVCDRSVAPGCPASLPGGISAWQLRQLVRLLVSDPRVVSMDITEVDHAADSPDGRTVRLAALIVLEALSAVAVRKG